MRRSNRILCAALSVALAATLGGCRKAPTNDEPADELYRTPEEVFAALMAAGEREDWKGLCACLTDETRDKLAAGMLFAGAVAKGFARTDEEKARLKPIEDVLTRHGVGVGQPPPDGPGGKADFEWGMMKVVASIKDRNAFIADFLSASKQASDDPKKNPFAGQFFDFKDVKLEDVKTQGDSATGVAVARRNGEEAREPLNFRKVGGGWRIEIPERARGGAGVRPDEAEKATAEKVRKLGGYVGRDRLLPGQPVTEVSFAATRVTGEDLKVLAGLPQLRELNLTGVPISDADLKALAPLKQLRTLELAGTRVTDAGLEELRPLAGLRELGLAETGVTDEGLKHLAGLPELQVVWLRSTRITDAGLRELAKLTNLRGLGVGETLVTEEGVAGLAKALPNARIIR